MDGGLAELGATTAAAACCPPALNLCPFLAPAGLKPVQAMTQQTDKKGKEQEVFLGVKGNAQASAGWAASLPMGHAPSPASSL